MENHALLYTTINPESIVFNIMNQIPTIANGRLSKNSSNKEFKKKNSHQRCSIKTVVLKNFAIFTGSTRAGLQTFNFVIKRLQHRMQLFSCEYCEVFKNTYFEKHLWMATSVFNTSKVDCELGTVVIVKDSTLIWNWIMPIHTGLKRK